MPSPKDVVVGSVDDVLPPPLTDASTIDSPRNNVFIRRCGNETLLVGLKYPCSLFFQGVLEVNVLAGKLIAHGYVASSADSRLPLRLFSLKDGSAQSLSTSEDSHVFASELDRFNHCQEFKNSIEDVLECVRPVGCIICVSSKRERYKNWEICFDRHQFDLFPKIQKAVGFPLFAEAEHILGCLLDVDDGSRILGKFKISDEFEAVSSAILSRFIALPGKDLLFKTVVCGGKGVGKSSYLKYIMNKFLNHTSSILYVDLDIGQPEFTLCGCVSAIIIDSPLIGPNYSHLKQPLRSYFVGDVNPLQCLSAYITAVSELIKFCSVDEQCTSMPWFVNTMGMTKGLGRDIMAMIISFLKPDQVIQIKSQNKQDNFSVLITPSFLQGYKPNIICEALTEIDFHHYDIISVGKTQTRSISLPSAARLRELLAVVYFSNILSQNDKVARTKWTHTCTIRNCIFGDIIALCKSDGLANICYGFGILYEEPEAQEVAILSPVDSEVFQNADNFLKSPIVFKSSVILQHFSCLSGSIPHFCTMNTQIIESDKRDLMKALFLLD